MSRPERGAEEASAVCRLQDAAGRVEACPGSRCPFWAEGGGGLPALCALERLELDLAGSPELTHAFLKLRRALERGAGGAETRSLFSLLAPAAAP